ncbi:hypothetical protein NUW54_g13221 [Trametes sanguinea]|uniref:Uncharacterized protein n=1 Tax=Trametes sanguinea TaxID=158606 RepID=A0ACC1MN35_9APHY|nr:hypothetical protein NUW54_g13221 [Trametes sanguinea]
MDTEDYLATDPMIPNLMDARRLSDNKLVQFKRVRRTSPELEIATYLSSAELRNDPRNHSVPIWDVLDDPQDDTISYLVMPLLRYLDSPPFETVENVLDCCEQLIEVRLGTTHCSPCAYASSAHPPYAMLQGMVFLHEHGVAHRDCAYKNLLVDADALYPRGFHPMRPDVLPDEVTVDAPVLSRRNIPVKYYYIDFGISSRFEPDQPDRLVTGTDGMERLVPELSKDVPYDPFKVDIFILGCMFYETFLEKYTNVDMIAPLVSAMVVPDPKERPSAVSVLTKFQGIRRGVTPLQASWRLRPRSEPLVLTAVLDTVSLVRTAFNSVF